MPAVSGAPVPSPPTAHPCVQVTGSTDGIGRQTALLLAQHSGTVLVHGRDKTRVRKTLRALKEASGNPAVFGYAYDLSSLAQTRAFADHVRQVLGGRGPRPAVRAGW